MRPLTYARPPGRGVRRGSSFGSATAITVTATTATATTTTGYLFNWTTFPVNPDQAWQFGRCFDGD